jgi:hypothetical protein
MEYLQELDERFDRFVREFDNDGVMTMLADLAGWPEEQEEDEDDE